MFYSLDHFHQKSQIERKPDEKSRITIHPQLKPHHVESSAVSGLRTSEGNLPSIVETTSKLPSRVPEFTPRILMLSTHKVWVLPRVPEAEGSEHDKDNKGSFFHCRSFSIVNGTFSQLDGCCETVRPQEITLACKESGTVEVFDEKCAGRR